MASKTTLLLLLSIFFFLLLFCSTKGSAVQDPKPSAFEFIKHLQGCHKGTKVQGIHNLKLYLARFGYLNYQHTPNHVDSEDDNFDEELEAALRSYQKFYHLNATGTLDEPTVSKMVMPRCGRPDKKAHKHDSKMFHTVSHFQFFQGTPRWPQGQTHLTYAFTSNYPTAYVPPVVRAFGKWASASGYFTFSRVGNIAGANLKIDFRRGDHGDGYPFDGPGGVLAHAFPPTNGRFDYDADENWSDGPVPNAYDLETLALHEIGHLLGLAHSEDSKAIMWSSFAPGVTKDLTVDDIRGIKTLYGIN